MNEETKITPLPQPPSTADAASFDERADSFLSALPQFAEELNDFSQKISDETKERVETTIKASIDARLDENDERLKKELVDEVAAQTNGLKRQSVRLLDVPYLDYKPDNNYIVNDERCVAYQLVTRKNDAQDDKEIVEYGDVIVPLFDRISYRGAYIYQYLTQTRLPLPRVLKDFERWVNTTTEGRGGQYLDAAAHIEGAELIKIIEGDTFTRSQVGVNSFAISCKVGLCTYTFNADKKTAEFYYQAPLLNEDRSDVITLNINNTESFINVMIKRREHAFSEDELEKKLQWKYIESDGVRFLCHCDEMKDSVLYFSPYNILSFVFRSRTATFNSISAHNGFKFTFPCAVKKIFFKAVPLVLLEDGSVWTMGIQENGECGLGSKTEIIRFTQNPALNKIKDIFSNGKNFFALTQDEGLLAWGINKDGSLGIGNATAQLSPLAVNIKFPSPIKDIACGNSFTHILLEDGTVWRAGAACTEAPFNATMTFLPMTYQKYKHPDNTTYDPLKDIKIYGVREHTGEALPYEKIKKIWATSEVWMMQCESGELCFTSDNVFYAAAIQGSADAFAPLPSIKCKHAFGEIEEVYLNSSVNIDTNKRIGLVWFKKNDTHFYVCHWGYGVPVPQITGEVGGGNLDYDFDFIDLGLNANERVDMHTYGYGMNNFDMCIVVKNKLKDDFYHWVSNKGFVKIAY